MNWNTQHTMYNRNPGGGFSEGIGKGIKSSFQNGSSLIKLIYINIGLFLLITILSALAKLTGNSGSEFYSSLLEWLGVPAYPQYLLIRPWTLFTYMFTHFEFLHLLFNMAWLFWFGSLFLNDFTQKQLVGVYVFGGISGASLYIGSYTVFPYFDELTRLSSWAIGASASVMAIVFAVCIYHPQQKIYMFLIGPVKLIYLALFTALIDILSIQHGNAGGHIAHLGGALFGCCFSLGMKRNKDLSYPIIKLLELVKKLFSPKKRIKVKYKKNASKMNDQEYNAYKKAKENKTNEILDKISKSGYESLTREEKALLFKAHK